MRSRFPNVLVAFVLTAACGTAAAQPEHRVIIHPRASPPHARYVDVASPHVVLDAFIAAQNVRHVLDTALVQQVASAAESAALRRNVSGSRVNHASGGRPAVSDTPGLRLSPSIVSVMACIRSHESGDYGEHSHISDGSGAYQAIPGTWRNLSALAGYGGYAYEYLAPPNVQDAVVAWALANGHAGNWSMRYGNDPCTAGLPGGG